MSAKDGENNSNQKYDRQIRIWGEDGQDALNRASVCVINASATATELLKNLVLAGIASFTIVDGQNILPQDYATNFFLGRRSHSDATSSLSDNTTGPAEGASIKRARAVVEAMHELNETVDGSFIPEPADKFLTSPTATRAFVRPFSVVIVTQMNQSSRVVTYLSNACAALHIPLVYVRSYGLCAQLRLQIYPYYTVRNARSDASEAPDLYIHAPFPSLAKYVESVDLEKEGHHVPFVVLLIRAVQIFKDRYGKLATSREEKNALTEILKSLRPSSVNEDAENYAEALRPAHLRLCYSNNSISSEVNAVLHHPRLDTVTSEQSHSPFLSDNSSHEVSLPPMLRVVPRSRTGTAGTEDGLGIEMVLEGGEYRRKADEEFWLCVAAIRSFVDEIGRLPVSGTLPDMTADTESYVKLQQLYKAQAREDAATVHRFAIKLAEKQRPSKPAPDLHTVEAFCRVVRHIRVVSSRTIAQEFSGVENSVYQTGDSVHGMESDCPGDEDNAYAVYDSSKGDFGDVAMMEGALDSSCANSCASPFYVALRAVDQFEELYHRLPGLQESTYESDISHMQDLGIKIREQVGISKNLSSGWREVIHEIVRYGAAETHCVAAFIGGIAAQEVIKLVTGQFVPLSDSLIFNMANMISVTFRA